MFEFNNELEITISKIPLQWIPKIELYYPDLPQFPIIYIHLQNNFGKRLIACPVAVSYKINNEDCDATFTVLTNVDNSRDNIDIIKNELENRIGYSNRITKDDLLKCCQSNTKYINLLSDLWSYVETSYGTSIPYGKYYEEIFSIVRFVSAWQPKTGRQSEMRMLYNFMSIFGEKIKMPLKWSHLEFYVIPNINDILSKDLNDFKTFSILDSAINKLFTIYFTKDVTISSTTFKVMEHAWKQNKEYFIDNVSTPLFKNGTFTESEKFYSEKLIDAFNRHSWRGAYFISSYMNIDKKYNTWNKSFFIDFYTNGSKLKGYSEKVIACFLQQGFLNQEVIPIDTWIETFYKYPLGINDRSIFFNNFNTLGKLERIIWLSSQSNKTNMSTFFDILWCQRYGTNGNKSIRGINPIACYSCKLKNTCVGLSTMKTKQIRLINNISPQKIPPNENTLFTCYLVNGIPKKCYQGTTLIDEFSGYILNSNDKLPTNLLSKNIVTMDEFIFHS